MYKGKRFVAVVPARGGSKGIPLKNIVPVAGLPLIAYTLLEARKSQYVDQLIVSTDSEAIANVARENQASVLMRPPELASDTSKTIDALLHVVDTMQEQFDNLILLQPTQPLRKQFHIDEAIEQFVDKEVTSLVSVSPARHHPLLMRTLNHDGTLSRLVAQTSTVRRQDFQSYYAVNGAIYINQIDSLDHTTSLNDNEYAYVMDQRYDLDIDEISDLKAFEMMLKNPAYFEV